MAAKRIKRQKVPTSIFTALTRCNAFGLIYPFQEKIMEKSAQSSTAEVERAAAAAVEKKQS